MRCEKPVLISLGDSILGTGKCVSGVDTAFCCYVGGGTQGTCGLGQSVDVRHCENGGTASGGVGDGCKVGTLGASY